MSTPRREQSSSKATLSFVLQASSVHRKIRIGMSVQSSFSRRSTGSLLVLIVEGRTWPSRDGVPDFCFLIIPRQRSILDARPEEVITAFDVDGELIDGRSFVVLAEHLGKPIGREQKPDDSSPLLV